MKKISFLFTVLGLVIIISLFNTEKASAAELSSDEIFEKFGKIAEEYEVGEELSEEDQEFVKKYAKKEIVSNPQITPFKTQSYSKTKTSSGVTVKISGSVNSTHGFINNTFGGTVNATITKGATPKRIKAFISHEAFGTVGSGGIGKVYSGSLTNTCDSTKTCKTGSMSRKYTASVVYSMTRAYADVTTSTGKKFTIYGN